MNYQTIYQTPIHFDNILIISNGSAITKLNFIQNHTSSKNISHLNIYPSISLPIFIQTCHWLDIYFKGTQPNFTPNCYFENITPFRKIVLEEIQNIPLGTTLTYGDLASRITEKNGLKRICPRAVANALAWNPICIIFPCHRVVGKNNRITGYNGGIHNKAALLELEASIEPHWG